MKQILLCSTQLPFTSNHNLLKWSNVTVANTRYKFNTFAKQNKNGWNMAKLKGQCSPFPSFYGCVPNQSDGNKPDCKLGIAPVISKQVTKSRLWHQYSWNNSTQFSEELLLDQKLAAFSNGHSEGTLFCTTSPACPVSESYLLLESMFPLCLPSHPNTEMPFPLVSHSLPW